MDRLISIAEGNTKLGTIPNISFPPILACKAGIPCAKCGECYALKAWRQYKETRDAWTRNFELAKANPDLFFSNLESFLRNKKRIAPIFPMVCLRRYVRARDYRDSAGFL